MFELPNAPDFIQPLDLVQTLNLFPPFSLLSGFIKSPNYPTNQRYPNGFVCQKMLHVSGENEVQILALEFNVGKSGNRNCSDERVEIWEMPDNGKWRSSGEFCQGNSPSFNGIVVRKGWLKITKHRS